MEMTLKIQIFMKVTDDEIDEKKMRMFLLTISKKKFLGGGSI